MLTHSDLTFQFVQTIIQEVTTICNLKCPTCRVTQANLKPDFLGFSEFVQICHNLNPYIKMAEVYNISSSESLLHPRWSDMIAVVKNINPKIHISIITNGMLLDEKKQDTLLNLGVKNICVSIDGAKRETVEKIRVGSHFETIINNVRGFISKGGLVRTIYTVRKSNINDLIDFVDLADDLGLWYIKCTGLMTFRPQDVKECLYSYEGLPEIDKIFQKAKVKAEAKKIKFTHKPTKLVENEGYCCLANTMYVGVHGDVSPCTYFSIPSPMTLFDKTRTTEPIIWGNVLEKHPQNIWLSDESLSFRQGMQNGTNCDLCGMKYVPACGRAFDSCEEDL